MVDVPSFTYKVPPTSNWHSPLVPRLDFFRIILKIRSEEEIYSTGEMFCGWPLAIIIITFVLVVVCKNYYLSLRWQATHIKQQRPQWSLIIRREVMTSGGTDPHFLPSNADNSLSPFYTFPKPIVVEAYVELSQRSHQDQGIEVNLNGIINFVSRKQSDSVCAWWIFIL